MHFVEFVLHDPCREYVGDAGVETGTEQGAEAVFAEAVLIGPLPGILEMGGFRRLVVGRVEVMHAALKAGVHDMQVLVGQGNVEHHERFDRADELTELRHVVSVNLGRGNLHAVTLPDALGDLPAAGFRAARQRDVPEGAVEGSLGALVGNDTAHTARADNENIYRHIFSFRGQGFLGLLRVLSSSMHRIWA